jgi:hypothetical protein
MPPSFTPIPQPTGKTDTEREARIQDEIIVDAYDDDEVFNGWYHYLQDTLAFPFPAYVHMENPKQLNLSILVSVLGMADMKLCSAHSMWLQVHVKDSDWYFYIPTSEIMEAQADAQTVQALADWKYWTKR